MVDVKKSPEEEKKEVEKPVMAVEIGDEEATLKVEEDVKEKKEAETEVVEEPKEEKKELKVVKVGGKYIVDKGESLKQEVKPETEKIEVNEGVKEEPASEKVESKEEVKVEKPVEVKEEKPKEEVVEEKTSEKATTHETLESEVPLEKTNRRLYIIGISLVVLILVATGGIWYFRSKLEVVSDKEEGMVEVEQVVEEVVLPSPAPEIVQLTPEEISLEVLNGSGVSGLAGETASKLEELGYIIEKTGNASDSTQNEVYIQEELEAQLETLMRDLKSELKIGSIAGYLEDSEATARVVLGAGE